MKLFTFWILFCFAGSLFAQNFAVTNYTTSNCAIASNSITALTSETINLWVGTTSSGLSKYDGTNWTTYTTTNGMVSNSIKSLDHDASGNIWIATSGGLSKLNGTTFTNYTTSQGLPSNDLRSVFVDNAGNIWIGTTSAGVSKFNGVSFTNYTTTDGLQHNTVLGITQDLSGNMWFGTATGVSKFNGATWTNYTNLNGLNTNGDQVQTATIDADGNIWVGSLPGMGIGGGLYKWDGSSWTCYTTADGLTHNDVRGIACDAKSRLWIATNGNGTSHFRNSVFTTYSTGAGLVSATQTCSEIDINGFVWIGTTGGLSRIQTIVYNSSSITDSHCGNNDGSITLNIGTVNGPVYYSYDLGITYTTSNILSNLTAGTYQIKYTDSSMFYGTALVVNASNEVMNAISATSYNLCNGDSMQPGVNTSFTNCQWTPETVVSSASDPNPFISPSSNMWVYLSYTDTNGCVGEDSVQFFVMPVPNIFVNISNDSVFTSPLIFSYYQWYWYGDTIPGATGQTYTATQPGIYMLCAHNAGQCTGCSDPINYMNEGIDEQNDWAKIFVNDGTLHWNLPEENCLISIYTPEGRLTEQFSVTGKSGMTELNNAVRGIVLIHVQRGDEDAWFKAFAR